MDPGSSRLEGAESDAIREPTSSLKAASVGSASWGGQAPCPTCAGRGAQSSPMFGYVYALGRIEQPRFPRASVEKEFAQACSRADTAGKTDTEVLHAVLRRRENRYLARQMCWVFSVHDLDTYLIQPRDPVDFDQLLESIRPAPTPQDLDVLIGIKGPIASPDLCNGLTVPIVGFDQIYSFDTASLIAAIPRPGSVKPEAFGPAAQEVFSRIIQLADNAGATDEHRALNYLAVRYSAIYARAAEAFAQDFAITAVEVRPSALNSTRRIVDVIFAFTNRNTDFTEKSFVRVDVTEEFPFLVTKMSPYYDR